MTTTDALQAEGCWRECCAALGCTPADAEAVWDELRTAYAESWRHYHTMAHVTVLLALRREHSALFRDALLVDLAIFLHDVVYEPRRGGNEAASAAWARSRLHALGRDAALTGGVAHLIEMSRHDAGDVAAVDPLSDLALFLDLDLSILAADAEAYDEYARAIRREYAVYPDLLYRHGRAQILRGFLARPSLYASAHFAPVWEAPARGNIARELSALGG